MKQIQTGFTLIELMVVITVLGILSALALAAYEDYLARTQLSEAMGLASGGKSSVAEYYQNTGVYPNNNSAAGLADPFDISGKFVESVIIEAADAGVIKAEMRGLGDVSAGVAGAFLTLSPKTHGGSFEWVCKAYEFDGGPLPNKYLPTVCRR